ncbi:MAG TPA: hypothetical protein PKX87_08840 [Alphaproteobacteria bacterium]|nr:hypothetical protein [Alphaproteobacteria bacterium]
MAVPTAFLAYRALKTRSLSTAFQDAADLVMERQHLHETRAEILHDIAQELVRYAGDGKSLTLTPQDMTPTLTEIIRYAGTQGVRVDVILPNSGKTAQVEYKPAQTLANIVEQIAPPSIPALPKPHPEQGKWANGLSASFNRLSNAITALEPELRNTAQPLINTVKAVQTLCVEIAIANSRIGKVTQELDNVSEQVEAYAQMKRFGIARAEDQDALTKVFEVKTASIAERFVPDLAAVRHSFEDRFKLLEKDYI